MGYIVFLMGVLCLTVALSAMLVTRELERLRRELLVEVRELLARHQEPDS